VVHKQRRIRVINKIGGGAVVVSIIGTSSTNQFELK